MELRSYLQAVQRYRRLVAAAVVLGMAAALLLHVARTPIYRATAKVLLLPNDRLERLNANQDNTVVLDPDRYAAMQANVMISEAVAERAARGLGFVAAEKLVQRVSVEPGEKSDILSVQAEDSAPTRARDMANGLVAAYIDDRRQLEVAGLQRAADEIGVRLKELKARIDQLSGAGQGRRGTGAALDGLSSADLQAANQQYQSLFGRQQDLLIEISLKRGGAELIAPARAPTEPVGPSLPESLALGGLVGLMLGAGVGLLLDTLDDRIRSVEEAQKIAGLPLLGEVPFDRSALGDPHLIPTADCFRGELAEAVRSLRTNITFLGLEKPVPCTLVTSASPGEGKTFLATNLAVAYAQAGSHTLLVSADLRRPRLEEIFSLRPESRGLTDLFFSAPTAPYRPDATRVSMREIGGGEPSPQRLRADLEAAVVPTRIPGLWLLPTGTLPPNPAELLSSKRMDEVLEQLQELFEVVILDAPPMLPVTDAAALGQKVGNVLLVASVPSTHRRALARLVSAATSSHARVLGVVVNKVRSRGRQYPSYYIEPTDHRVAAHAGGEGPKPTGVEDRRVASEARPATPSRTQ